MRLMRNEAGAICVISKVREGSLGSPGKLLKSQRFRQIWENKTTATYVQLSEFGE